MKKILALLLSILILLAPAALPAAAARPVVRLLPASKTVYPGKTVEIPVEVKDCTSKSLGIIPQFDTSVFEYVENSGEWKLSGALISDNSPECATILFSEAQTFSGVVFSFRLRVKDNVMPEFFQINVEVSAEGYDKISVGLSLDVQCEHVVHNWSKVNDGIHTGTCERCKATLTQNHTYANACASVCTACGAERSIKHSFGTAYVKDATGHWHVCVSCGEKSPVEAHVPGPEATEYTPQTCTVCGFELAPAKGHTHVFDGNYVSDAAGHRRTCVCGETAETEAHIWDAGTVKAAPAVGSAGIKVYRCTACGYEKQVELEYYPVEVTVPVENTQADIPAEERTSAPAEDAPKTGPAPQTEAPETEKSGCGAEVSAGALVTGLLPAAILMKKRKKEDVNA